MPVATKVQPVDAPGLSSEIATVECFPALLPLKKPLVMSTYRIDAGPVLFVRVRARNGAEGWGEAAASPIMSGETLKGMVAAVEEMIAPRLVGRSVADRAAACAAIRQAMYGNRGALAAVDMALLDLAGRLSGLPAVDLLGGALRRSVAPLWLIGGSGDTDRDVADARALHADGVRQFKLKVGLAPVLREVETIRQLRAALGEGCLIAADANMGWDVETAVRFARGVAPFALAFLEQPTPAGDLGRLCAVAARAPVPLGADENIHGVSDILRHHEARAVRGMSLKTIKLGGITQVTAAGALCDVLGLSVNLAMMMESTLAATAMLHAACALPNVDWGLSLGNLWLAEDPVLTPLACRDGRVHCPSAPGFGVEVDERRLAALAP